MIMTVGWVVLAIDMINPYTQQKFSGVWDYLFSFLFVPEFLIMAVAIVFLLIVLFRLIAITGLKQNLSMMGD